MILKRGLMAMRALTKRESTSSPAHLGRSKSPSSKPASLPTTIGLIILPLPLLLLLLLLMMLLLL
jgi:hypothetical protein